MRLETHYGKAEVSTYRTQARALEGIPPIAESEFWDPAFLRAANRTLASPQTPAEK